MSAANQWRSAVDAVRRYTTRAGSLAAEQLGLHDVPRLTVTSFDFEHLAALPMRCTAEGDGCPPPLTWQAGPAGTQSFALLCEDPEGPHDEPLVLWLVFGIPAKTCTLDANLSAVREGLNSRGEVGFMPANPPIADGPHDYHFQLFALDRNLELSDPVTREELLEAIDGHVLAWGDLVGTYEHP